MRYAIRFMKLTKHVAMVRENDEDAVELGMNELAGLAPFVPRKGEWFSFHGREGVVTGPVKEVVTIVSSHPWPRCVVEVYILPRELL